MDAEFGPAALAIVAGELDTLADLLAADPGLATRRSSVGHPTLLQLIACEEGHVAEPVGAARLLVEAGAEVDGPLVAAAGCDARATLEFLLDAGASAEPDVTWTPLDEALYWDNTEMADLLLERGARIRRLRNAAGLGDLDAISRFIVDDGHDRAELTADAGPLGSPFPETVTAEHAEDPQAIIDHAFVMAVNSGHQAAAEYLLKHGAKVNAIPPGYHWRGTALHAACWRGDGPMVEWLLSVGADPSISDGMDGVGADAIGWARHHGHEHLVALLS